MFIAGRSHGASPIPGVLKSVILCPFDIAGFCFNAYLRDAFTGTGMRWFPSDDQLVPIELNHPEFFHYIGWTGHWDYQDRRGTNPGWQKALTPPHSPYGIMRRGGVPGDLTIPTLVGDSRWISWRGHETRHGPRGPYAWDSAILKNPWFEDNLNSWKAYGDGFVEASHQEAREGEYSVHLQRNGATGDYFGLYQNEIAIEPNTEYQLSLWAKTEATGGSVAAALGVWSSDPTRNHHIDFGFIGGTTDWIQISGTWTSRPDETRLQVVLYGQPDFAGSAFFDGLVLQKVIP
jgi:hypothetical protein